MTKSNSSNWNKGRVEVICGSMFSGKTEELLRRSKRAAIARLKVGYFKPEVDIRFHKDKIRSHDENESDAISIQSSRELLRYLDKYDVFAIDEAQFFDLELSIVIDQLANSGKRILVAGLDMDSFGKPFGPMPSLLAMAEIVTKLQAVCVACGDAAHYSKRLKDVDEQFFLGAKENYEPLCRSCYINRR